MSDRLLEAIQALRETTNGEASAIGRYTRSRVLSAVRLQRRRRVLNVAFGIPLAAILIGSGAWAASGQSFPLFARRLTAALGLRAPPAVPALLTLKERAAAKSGASAPVDPLSASALPTEPLIDQAAVERTNELPATAQPAAVQPAVADERARVGADAATAAPELGSSPKSAASTPRDSHITELELSLYQNAHRAHFVDKDAGAALAAWNDYLRQMPRGRFAVEASYNRALCLVRLGRSAQAREALLPFARGAFGNYRRTEAAALVEELSAQ
jgi:hypothetical protein